MIHGLKCKTQYLDNLIDRKKTSEVRFNDRDFQVGDIVELFEYDEQIPFTSKTCSATYVISHIHSGLGMAENYVVLSFKKIKVL